MIVLGRGKEWSCFRRLWSSYENVACWRGSRVGEGWNSRRVDWLLALTLSDLWTHCHRRKEAWTLRRERARKWPRVQHGQNTLYHDFQRVLLSAVARAQMLCKPQLILWLSDVIPAIRPAHNVENEQQELSEDQALSRIA